MFTDTVGYTASTQSDEGRTLDLLRQQAELVRPLVAMHQGREIKSTGDGFLVEFDSALKATQCAVNIQRRIYERNAEGGLVPIRIRIGIHLGDVVQRGSDILGDAVNIAARIEPIAEPGGICLSGAVHEQIRNKIPDKLEKLPPTALKGLEVPMDMYRVVLPWLAREPSTAVPGPTGIAVLPFTNISPDPKDEYFADGLTEELITVLSQLRDLRVISRTSVMQFKATTKAVSQIGTELGVSSVLEGSVRKAGNRLRITAQLIDAGSDRHLWAKTFDRELDDVFAVQTEIAKQVAEALQVELLAPERGSIRNKPTSNLEAYDLYLKGIHAHLQSPGEGSAEAIKLLEAAIRKDVGFALAYSYLANLYIGLSGDAIPPKIAFPRAKELLDKALELDPNSSEAHTARGNLALQYSQDWGVSETEFRRAIYLNPSNANAHFWYAMLLKTVRRFDESVEELRTTIELDPLWESPKGQLVVVYFLAGDFKAALALQEEIRDRNPSASISHVATGLILAYMGRTDEARKEAELASGPMGFDVERWFRALLWAKLGELNEARLLLADWEVASTTRYVTPSSIAGLYAVLGEKEKALERLERDYSEGERDLWFYYPLMAFDSLRADPRFQALLKKMNLA
jgi:adenylate cyclase